MNQRLVKTGLKGHPLTPRGSLFLSSFSFVKNRRLMRMMKVMEMMKVSRKISLVRSGLFSTPHQDHLPGPAAAAAARRFRSSASLPGRSEPSRPPSGSVSEAEAPALRHHLRPTRRLKRLVPLREEMLNATHAQTGRGTGTRTHVRTGGFWLK